MNSLAFDVFLRTNALADVCVSSRSSFSMVGGNFFTTFSTEANVSQIFLGGSSSSTTWNYAVIYLSSSFLSEVKLQTSTTLTPCNVN